MRYILENKILNTRYSMHLLYGPWKRHCALYKQTYDCRAICSTIWDPIQSLYKQNGVFLCCFVHYLFSTLKLQFHFLFISAQWSVVIINFKCTKERRYLVQVPPLPKEIYRTKNMRLSGMMRESFFIEFTFCYLLFTDFRNIKHHFQTVVNASPSREVFYAKFTDY